MKKNWIITEAEKADDSKDLVILENPETKEYLDKLLLEKFWPVILNALENSNYNYSSEPEIESTLGYALERSLVFMLLDGKMAFFRGALKVAMEGWMLNNEFFLSLPKQTDPQVIIALLGNSRLRGYPPALEIDREKEDDFYQITFNVGKGAGWGLHGEKYIKEEIEKVIDVNVRMYEFTQGGISLPEIGKFLTMLYEVYENF